MFDYIQFSISGNEVNRLTLILYEPYQSFSQIIFNGILYRNQLSGLRSILFSFVVNRMECSESQKYLYVFLEQSVEQNIKYGGSGDW